MAERQGAVKEVGEQQGEQQGGQKEEPLVEK
jgi:hypothetical protein